jgi:4-amino-4-deoxy-L-arabinose transferase-like glycosyltransferase
MNRDPVKPARTTSILARARAEPSALLLPAAIVVMAAALRLWTIRLDAANPFYDAAVRSMGSSWHNFFFGALDPSGRLAIDKPPVDLWLQVASTKLLGFNRTALALPEALGGIAAVALLYAAVTHACGRVAGGIAALALAVLPVAVLTARSDTMDSLMSALLIGALWTAVVAAGAGAGRRRIVLVLASAALVGAAFDVKLGQALIPLPALALLWWIAARAHRRGALLGAAAVVLVVVAMAWAFTASLTPLSARPFPMGSHDGSIYRAMFVFDGIERLTGTSRLAPSGFGSPPGVGRLLSSGIPHYSVLIGLELLAAVALLVGAGALWTLTRKETLARRGVPATGMLGASIVWLAVGYVLFSSMRALQPRYLETISPALAAVLGIATAYLLAHAHTRRAAWLCAAGLALNAAFAAHACGVGDTGVQICVLATAGALAGLCSEQLRRAPAGAKLVGGPHARATLLTAVSLALLAAPAEASIDLVEERASDANPTGSGSQFSAYLRAHRDGARYEVAAANPLAVVGLIAQDDQPVLVLRSVDGVLVSVSELRRLVGEGAVRYAILPHPCSSGRHCTPTTAWSIRNSVMVRPGLYRYVAPSRQRRVTRSRPAWSRPTAKAFEAVQPRSKPIRPREGRPYRRWTPLER